MGLRPFEHAPLTVSEAAGSGEAHVLLNLLYNGANPLARYSVGQDVIKGSEPRDLTPLEAAVVGNQPAIIGLLERWSVPIDDMERNRLLCLAVSTRAQLSVGALSRPGVVPSCAERVPS
ncbi:MAG: hypothetical protein ABL993_01155, partial [Vicinamibacterales bacterium]